MAKASRTISHIQEQMEQNCIFESWTQTWGLKVYPAYGIDKLKFSFVEKGAKGEGKSFDIYMDCLRDGAACFDNWAYDILHGRIERILSAEKQAGEKYPKFYKFLTGETAEKSMGIMNSQNGGYCMNASVPGDDDKKIYANVPVSFHDLRHIAERYMVSFEPRRSELEEIRKKAEKDSRNWDKAEDTEAKTTTESKPAQAKEEVKEQPKSEKKPEAKEKQPTPETTAVKLKTQTELTPNGKGGFVLTAIDAKNKVADYVFPKQYWDAGKYGDIGEDFKEKATANTGLFYVLHFYTYKGKNYVASIENSK